MTSLRGCYVAAEDLGVTVDDMRFEPPSPDIRFVCEQEYRNTNATSSPGTMFHFCFS
jgi:hypothetical protein